MWSAKKTESHRVKYWESTMAILAVLYASIALADDFKTMSGKEYKNATVSRAARLYETVHEVISPGDVFAG